MDGVLKKSLHVLFHNYPAEDVIENYLNSSIYKRYIDILSNIHNESFQYRMNIKYDNLSDNEVSNISKYLCQVLAKNDLRDLGVFAPLFRFADQTIVQDNGDPVVKYERILGFREVAHDIGSDVLTCAFLAKQDFKQNTRRVRFDFPLNLKTDNRYLQNILKQGLAENHFHLKGSTHSSALSWIYLMNNVRGQGKKFEKFQLESKVRNTELLFRDVKKAKNFRELVYYAAVIRYYLFNLLKGFNYHESIAPLDYQLNASSTIIEHYAVELQRGIDIFKASINRSNKNKTLDYINISIEESKKRNDFYAFAGERLFLYSMFYAILENNDRISPYFDLFYAYLLISAKLRGELIQTNAKTGFANFKEYQDRKSEFFSGVKEYEEAQIALAFATTLGTHHYRLKSLEARFIPKDEKSKIVKQITLYDKLASNEKDSICQEIDKKDMRHFYVLHIPKVLDDEMSENLSYQYCRHYKFRSKLEKVAIAITKLRDSCSDEGMRIYGIDACSNEIGCRPEVFAQVFRYIKNHHTNNTNVLNHHKTPPKMNITYHVGEDYLDIVDGLRAIDEAILFLNMNHGDRLGHAIALGIDAEFWYKKKDYTVVLPRQDLLDNCAWMLEKLHEFGYDKTDIIAEIHKIYKREVEYIYNRNMMYTTKEWKIDYDDYMDSWRLRGDNPYLYKKVNDHEFYYRNISALNPFYGAYFRSSRLSPYSKNMPDNEMMNEIRRDNHLAGYLMYNYHFNYRVKKCGSEIIEYNISRDYIRAVSFLQECMRRKIAKIDIGIECNPSSNVLIGGLKRYDRHPILNFNSCGLDTDGKATQMLVSINTDDQGVFDTSLENEYALMACTLQNITDNEGKSKYSNMQIYNYLDMIRKMGLELSFRNQYD